MRKATVEKWKNGVSERIEKKFKSTLERIGFVMNVEMYSRNLGEYNMKLTSSRCSVVNLIDRRFSYRGWQLRGLPCVHAMTVIEKEKLWVYDYVYPCYKAPT